VVIDCSSDVCVAAAFAAVDPHSFGWTAGSGVPPSGARTNEEPLLEGRGSAALSLVPISAAH
jgi:hypothetical protein